MEKRDAELQAEIAGLRELLERARRLLREAFRTTRGPIDGEIQRFLAAAPVEPPARKPHPTNIADAVSCFDCGGPTRPVGKGLYECLSKACNDCDVEPQEAASDPTPAEILAVIQSKRTPAPDPLAPVLARLDALETDQQADAITWAEKVLAQTGRLDDHERRVKALETQIKADSETLDALDDSVTALEENADKLAARVNARESWARDSCEARRVLSFETKPEAADGQAQHCDHGPALRACRYDAAGNCIYRVHNVPKPPKPEAAVPGSHAFQRTSRSPGVCVQCGGAPYDVIHDAPGAKR